MVATYQEMGSGSIGSSPLILVCSRIHSVNQTERRRKTVMIFCNMRLVIKSSNAGGGNPWLTGRYRSYFDKLYFTKHF